LLRRLFLKCWFLNVVFFQGLFELLDFFLEAFGDDFFLQSFGEDLGLGVGREGFFE
jgi:hypothetical protein